jgi:serine/threonine-protein kinase RsbW
VIRIQLPAQLAYRDLVLRTTSAMCTLSGRPRAGFRHQVVTAVSEAFNNVVLHAYAGRSPGQLALEIEPRQEGLRIVMTDDGTPFDPPAVPVPDLGALPESGMGLFIIRSFMDEVVYTPGPPNVLVLVKSFSSGSARRAPGAARTG